MHTLASLIISLLTLIGVYHPSIVAGNFSPSGGTTYRLQTSIGTSDTSINLSSFKEPVSNIAYTMSYLNSSIEYGTLDPQTSHSEFISFTGISQNSDGTAQLTGVIRGLTRTPAGNFCTASTTLAQSHAGQSIFILSDSPCLFAEYVPLRNSATSSAVLIFGSTTPPRYDSTAAQHTGTYIATTSEFASVDYVNQISFSGTTNATEAAKGIVELATALEQASSSVLGSTGAHLDLQAQYATDTPQSGCASGFTSTAGASCSVIAQLTGKIRQTFLNLAELWTFTGGIASTGTTTVSAADLNTNPFKINTLAYRFPSSRGASSTVLAEDGSGKLSWYRPDFSVIASTTLSSGSASTTLSSIPAATDLRIMIDIPAISGAQILSLQFNADTGTNYAYSVLDMAGVNTLVDTRSTIRLDSTTAPSGSSFFTVIDVNNIATRPKLLNYRTSTYTGVGVSEIGYQGAGSWANTSAQINSVTVGATTQLPAGTRITVYGSNQ